MYRCTIDGSVMAASRAFCKQNHLVRLEDSESILNNVICEQGRVPRDASVIRLHSLWCLLGAVSEDCANFYRGRILGEYIKIRISLILILHL